MRILEVRFGNINSLAGEWRIDFENVEYRADGLFLISGPTGSGKTTLLDALSLALFGRTPRVAAPSKNSNEFMTRHTGFCYAEVAFETVEGRFRARWEQRRANKNPNGNLQIPTHELCDSQGKIISSRLSDTKKFVAMRLGLDFDQFVRSVLLAQNSFDAFLTAGEQEKSKILEKLTDTSIYSNLSILAFNKAKSSREIHEKLQDKLSALHLLDADAISEFEARKLSCQNSLNENGKNLSILREHLKWVQNLAALQDKYKKLQSEKEALVQKIDDFSSQRKLLQDAKLAAIFEADYLQLAQLRRLKEEIAQNQEKLANDLENNQKRLKHAELLYNQAQEQLGARQHELEQQKPVIEQARLLDSKLQEQRGLLASRQRERQSRQLELDNLQQSQTAKHTAASQIEKNIEQLRQWLGQNAGDGKLEHFLGGFTPRLEPIRQARGECEAIEKRLQRDQNELQKVMKLHEETAKELEATQQAERSAQAIIEDLQEKKATMLAGWTLAGLEQAYREKLVLNRQYKNLEDYRKALVAEQPCPLCGSLHHPWAIPGELPELDVEIREMEQRINNIHAHDDSMTQVVENRVSAMAKAEKLKERLNGQDNQIVILEKNLQEQAERKNKLLAQQREQEKQLRADLTEVGLDAEIDLDSVTTVLKKRIGAWEKANQNLEMRQQESYRINCELASMQANVENSAKSLQEAAQACEESKQVLENLQAERKQLLPHDNVQQYEEELAQAVMLADKNFKECERAKSREQQNIDRTQGELSGFHNQWQENEKKLLVAEADFVSALATKGMDETKFMQMRMDVREREKLEKTAAELDDSYKELDARLKDRMRELEGERARNLTDKPEPMLHLEIGKLEAREGQLRDELAKVDVTLQADQNSREQSKTLVEQINRQQKEMQRWENLERYIGSADGKKFRAFAQSITLDCLLVHANRQLRLINPRYTLKRATGSQKDENLRLEVIDHYQASEIRSIANLSGGETFMASLALALGLSEMAGKNTALGSLFLDEGFGTLDADALETAFSAIGKLKQEGKLIGIISHVEALKEWIPTQIKIFPQPGNPSRSRMEGPGCSGGCS